MRMGFKASIDGRTRSSGQIYLLVTTLHATVLKAILTKNQIICSGISKSPLLSL